ncbi:DUF2461 domain-containing protein [Sphingobacterium rhinopitheci]|uniref:DUF2461 domain-containing protein n=1 Tax=Sphingobacterium rhinopitheci TaxID=2781960 RepID=UPI001F52AF17|nr:DUF2461 domain-containing protein [Sphingobacterium rhinopitheci]MCI0921571.1 DUF2461 domain-containing protein [Sphingobacterium rhinopitheci]
MNIKASTFEFLSALKENNNREWFQANKADYDHAYSDVKNFVEELIAKLSVFDKHINTDIKSSKCMFRIYRDVRFAKDKSPYKSWLAAGISIDGRKLDGPEYYVHIEPGNSFVAVGYWQPKKSHLAAIRQEIDYDFESFEETLKLADGELNDLSQEDKLKRPPAGYSLDNPAIEILKLKSFIILKPISDRDMVRAFALEHITEMFQQTLPFKDFLHLAIEGIE